MGRQGLEAGAVMGQQPQYLSTDPNAGQAVEGGYLSTDPTAGTTAPEHEAHSLGGFGKNVLTSTGRVVKDAVTGLPSLLNLVAKANPLHPEHNPATTGQQLVGMLRAIPGAVKQRYGGLSNIGETAYHDPAGMAADVSTVTGLGGLAAGARAPRLAGTLRKIEQATNPLDAIAKPVVAAANKMGPGLQNVAVSSYERMLKPNKSTLEGMGRMGPTLEARSRAVAKKLIEDPHGQINRKGASRFKDETERLEQQVDAIVDANPEARGSTAHLRGELAGGRGTFAKQWAPSGDTSAYDSVATEVLNNPRVTKTKRQRVEHTTSDELGRLGSNTTTDAVGRELIPRVTAKGARELTRGTYRNLGDKAYGELKGAQTEAHKAAARGGRKIVNEALPAVEPLNTKISERIDLGQIQDEAVFRSGKHDPIGLSQQVVLSGNPWLIPASLINRPGVGSPIARGLFKAGGALDAMQTPNELLRAALVARLLGQDQ